MKKIAIIMLQYNRSDYTERTLESLYLHTSSLDFDLIIGDAGSESYHKQKLQELYVKYDFLFQNIKVVFLNENISIGKNKNKLIRMAKSHYLGIFDNDMEFETNWLPKATELFKETKSELLGLWIHPLHSIVCECPKVYVMNNIPGNCWLCTPELFREHGELAEIPVSEALSTMGEDSELIFRLQQKKANVFSVKENLLHHFGKVRSDGVPAVDADSITI